MARFFLPFFSGVHKKIILFYLSTISFTLRDPNDSNGGKLVLGGSDESLYTGEMNYIPLTRLGYWQVAMDSISVAGDKVRQIQLNLLCLLFIKTNL